MTTSKKLSVLALAALLSAGVMTATPSIAGEGMNGCNAKMKMESNKCKAVQKEANKCKANTCKANSCKGANKEANKCKMNSCKFVQKYNFND